MKISLQFKHALTVHPAPSMPGEVAAPAFVEIVYAVHHAGVPMLSKGGRYESDYTDSYTPHAHEFAALEELQALLQDKFRVRSRPLPKSPDMVTFEAVKVLPFWREMGEVELVRENYPSPFINEVRESLDKKTTASDRNLFLAASEAPS